MANALTEALDSLVAQRMDGNAQSRKELIKTVVEEQQNELIRFKSETVKILTKDLASMENSVPPAPAAAITALQRLLDQASRG